MVKLVNYDLRGVYKHKEGYRIFLGLEEESGKGEKVTLHFSARRLMGFNIKPKSEVRIIVYSREDNIFVVDTVEFNKNGVGNVDDVLRKHCIPFEPESLEEWQIFKRSNWTQSYMCVCDKGYYIVTYLWLDMHIWYVDMISKDGVTIFGGNTIKETYYEQHDRSIPEEHFAFLEKMITKGCTFEEYEAFKRKYIMGSGREYKEVLKD